MIDNWEALDKKTNGKVTAFTYIVLWLHDRVYSYSTDLYYGVKKSKYYRHAVKKTVNEIYNEAGVVCNENFSILGKSALFLSEVNGNVSGSMEKHIMLYKYAVQQALLDAGVGGEANELASQAMRGQYACAGAVIRHRRFQADGIDPLEGQEQPVGVHEARADKV